MSVGGQTSDDDSKGTKRITFDQAFLLLHVSSARGNDTFLREVENLVARLEDNSEMWM